MWSWWVFEHSFCVCKIFTEKTFWYNQLAAPHVVDHLLLLLWLTIYCSLYYWPITADLLSYFYSHKIFIKKGLSLFYLWKSKRIFLNAWDQRSIGWVLSTGQPSGLSGGFCPQVNYVAYDYWSTSSIFGCCVFFLFFFRVEPSCNWYELLV